jgi:rfaE bifunctional protein kinase chain/domain
MLNECNLEQIFSRLPGVTVGVVGDLFLDRYLEIDPGLTEPSLETGLDAYQVVRVRSQPGAAGTVINNLVALGVGRVLLLSIVGDDGEGYELRGALAGLGNVHLDHLVTERERGFRTPTYTKPLLCRPGQAPEELNRLDIKNRVALSPALESQVLDRLAAIWPQSAALLILDQVSLPNTGAITEKVRGHLVSLAERDPEKFVLADSRERIGLFQRVAVKPNEAEALGAHRQGGLTSIEPCVRAWASRLDRPVFCTRGQQGMLLAEPSGQLIRIPAYRVMGPIDVVGAGDSASAGIAAAIAAGADPSTAADFGNLVASITIQQIGTTGTACPGQIRARWHGASA